MPLMARRRELDRRYEYRLLGPFPMRVLRVGRSCGSPGRELSSSALEHRFPQPLDVFRKSLDQPPTLGQGSAARESRFNIAMVNNGQDAERTDDLPILFYQCLIGTEGIGNVFNEASIQHAQNSGKFRYRQSCGAPVFVHPSCVRQAIGW